MSGYILWYRKAESNPVLEDEKFDRLHAWLWMIERANYRRVTIIFNGKKRQLKRGQFITSTRKLATAFGWSVAKVRRFLSDLERNNMIKMERNTNGTLLTIEKYTFYQGSAHTNEHTLSTNEYTNEHTEPIEISTVTPIPRHTRAHTNELQRINKRIKKKPGRPDSLGGDRGPGSDDNYGDPRYREMELGEPDVL